jgi:transcription elongation factor GreA
MTTSSESPDPDTVYLTEEGRQLLVDRVRELEARAHELRESLEGDGRSDEVVTGYLRITRELERLRDTLESATPVDALHDDPLVVKFGDTVEIRLDDGSVEQYVIVHPAEAAVDDRRISVDSPLAQALIGQRVGAYVEVPAPRGAYGCTILRADRGVAPAG